MKQEKEVRISYWAAHLTTIVSVSLVLMLLGLIALIWIGAQEETRRLRERIELSVVMKDSVTDARAMEIAKEIETKGYARNVRCITKAEALANWKADTGEDLMALFGVNPLSPEVTFTLSAENATASGIAAIRSRIQKNPDVESIAAPDPSIVESMNRNIGRMTLLLAIVAGVMIVISFVLINNTVHLTIYSRRFTIHTMKLVGATNGFIRRPIVLNNLVSGIIAGLVAAGMIAAGLFAAQKGSGADIGSFISWVAYGIVAAALILAGMALCSLAASIAANKYLRKDYDELFR